MKTALINGKIYLSRGKFASAVLIEDEIITKVGTDDEVKALAAGAEIIDCEGRTVIPGLNDSHQHHAMIGQHLAQVNIYGSTSIDDVIDRCKKFIAENPDMAKKGIIATGWNQDLFTSGEKRYLYKHDLDRISTEIPIVLSRVCGHILAANSKAMEIAGIKKGSPQVDGGLFEFGEDGEPNGFFAESACNIVTSIIPQDTAEELEALTMKAMEYAVAHGLTSVQSNDVGQMPIGIQPTFDMIAKIYEEGRGLLRYHHQFTFRSKEEMETFLATEFKNTARYEKLKNWVTLGPLKLFKDGSLGARTATVRNEYCDDPGNFGVAAMTEELGETLIQLAAKNGIQVTTHAIGDKAIEDMLDHYSRVIDGENTLRHSIVHYQCLMPDLLERTIDLGVIAQVQPIFLTTDIHAVPSRFSPEMNRWFLAFKTYIERGIHTSFGSDAPVEDCNPFLGLYCAVTRKDVKGNPAGGFHPEECIDIETAIDCFTVESAYAEFKEGIKGRIKEGFLGDMVILDKDIFTCPADEIKDILPVRTIVGGKTMYKA